MFSCVLRYGDNVDTLVNDSVPQSVNFSDVEGQLDDLIAGEEDIDRLMRLEAARALCKQMKPLDPQAQRAVHDYLSALIEVEVRMGPLDVWVDTSEFTDLPHQMPEVAEEVLGADVGAVATTRQDISDEDQQLPTPSEEFDEPDIDPKALRTQARDLVAAGDSEGAMALLEVCRHKQCWEDVSATWVYASDMYVHQIRQSAARMFRDALAEQDHGLRQNQLLEIEVILTDLITEHSESRYAPAIHRSIIRVKQELASANAD